MCHDVTIFSDVSIFGDDVIRKPKIPKTIKNADISKNIDAMGQKATEMDFLYSILQSRKVSSSLDIYFRFYRLLGIFGVFRVFMVFTVFRGLSLTEKKITRRVHLLSKLKVKKDDAIPGHRRKDFKKT